MSQPPYGPQQPQYGPPPGPPPQWGPPPPPPHYGPPPQYGPPPGGPQLGWGGYGQPPPKKKGGAAKIVVPILLLVFVAGAGLWVWGVMAKKERLAKKYATPTSSYSYTPPPTVPTRAQPTYRNTYPTYRPPTIQRTTQAPQGPSDIDIVTKNRIYKTGIQRGVNCKESGSRATSLSEARKYFTKVYACLNLAWPRQVRAAGYEFRPPKMITFAQGGTMQSPCSGGAPSSFYCSVNETIYMHAGHNLTDYRKYSTYSGQYRVRALAYVRSDMLDTVAHEYGHHIQALTKISQATHRIEYRVGRDKALEMSRRQEIQASCFGNVFMGANKNSYPVSGALKREHDWANAQWGDRPGTPIEHWSKGTLTPWAHAAFRSRSPASCNTYVAPAKRVR